MTCYFLLLWATQHSRSAVRLLLKSTFRALFSNWVPYPGPLQAANLPVESCRALQSCNTEHSDEKKQQRQVYYLRYQDQTLSCSCLYQISFSVNEGQLAVVILTWHDALVHQLLPGSPLLKPQLQDWKQKGNKMLWNENRHSVSEAFWSQY